MTFRSRRISIARQWPTWLSLTLWVALLGWRLYAVPGLHMDEAWSALSAMGKWDAANPLSGMTRYSGPLPVVLLNLLDPDHPTVILRSIGALCNTLAMVLLALCLRRVCPNLQQLGFGLPLFCTLPVWLAFSRVGIEIAMFTPLLAIGGAFLLLRGGRRNAAIAGCAWGLSAFSHPLGLLFAVSFLVAWIFVYRAWPNVPWWHLLMGFTLGFLPRIVALIVYPASKLDGSMGQYNFTAAVLDLRFLPAALFGTLSGETVYERFVGRPSVPVLPFWAFGMLIVVPWLTRLKAVPKQVWVLFTAGLVMSVLTVISAPNLAIRYLVLPVILVVGAWVCLASATWQLGARYQRLVTLCVVLLSTQNCFYWFANFISPWRSGRMEIAVRALGNRDTAFSNWGYLPKDELANYLHRTHPAQVVSSSSIDRPLRFLLSDTNTRSVSRNDVDPSQPSVRVEYNRGRIKPKRCYQTHAAKICHSKPRRVGRHFVVYEASKSSRISRP